jgi:hypothetical protein
MLDGLSPGTHQYFDYSEATIVISVLENLQAGSIKGDVKWKSSTP